MTYQFLQLCIEAADTKHNEVKDKSPDFAMALEDFARACKVLRRFF